MNKVFLTGNLTKDAELKQLGNGTLTTFTIAVNDGWGDNQKTYFIPIKSFKADKVVNFLTKGTKVNISAKVVTGSYEKDGKTIYTTEFIADNFGGIELLGKNQSSSNNEADTATQNIEEVDFGCPIDEGNMPF